MECVPNQDKQVHNTFCCDVLLNLKMMTQFLQPKLCFVMTPLSICLGMLSNTTVCVTNNLHGVTDNQRQSQVQCLLYFILAKNIKSFHFCRTFYVWRNVKISPITGPGCPEGSRKLKFPNYAIMAQDGGKVVSVTHQPLLPPGNTSGTHFC